MQTQTHIHITFTQSQNSIYWSEKSLFFRLTQYLSICLFVYFKLSEVPEFPDNSLYFILQLFFILLSVIFILLLLYWFTVGYYTVGNYIQFFGSFRVYESRTQLYVPWCSICHERGQWTAVITCASHI